MNEVCAVCPRVESESGRFAVEVGVMVLVQKVAEGGTGWKTHWTRKPLSFERYEESAGGFAVFRHEGWFIRVPWYKLKRRHDHGKVVRQASLVPDRIGLKCTLVFP